MTRTPKNTGQQQQMMDVDEAVQILDQETPPLVMDKNKLKVQNTECSMPSSSYL